MLTRAYTPADFPTFSKWWEVRDGMPFSERLMPVTSVVVEHDERPIAICSMYVSMGREMADIAWIAATPDATSELRREAIKQGLRHLEYWAKELGCLMLFAESGHPAIMECYKETGFKLGDDRAQHFFKRVGN